VILEGYETLPARLRKLVIGGIGADFGSLERRGAPFARTPTRRQAIKNPGIRRFQGWKNEADGQRL